MLTVSGNPNPTNPTYPTNPTNPTTQYHCEFVNLNCIYTPVAILPVQATKAHSSKSAQCGPSINSVIAPYSCE